MKSVDAGNRPADQPRASRQVAANITGGVASGARARHVAWRCGRRGAWLALRPGEHLADHARASLLTERADQQLPSPRPGAHVHVPAAGCLDHAHGRRAHVAPACRLVDLLRQCFRRPGGSSWCRRAGASFQRRRLNITPTRIYSIGQRQPKLTNCGRVGAQGWPAAARSFNVMAAAAAPARQQPPADSTDCTARASLLFHAKPEFDLASLRVLKVHGCVCNEQTSRNAMARWYQGGTSQADLEEGQLHQAVRQRLRRHRRRATQHRR